LRSAAGSQEKFENGEPTKKWSHSYRNNDHLVDRVTQSQDEFTPGPSNHLLYYDAASLYPSSGRSNHFFFTPTPCTPTHTQHFFFAVAVCLSVCVCVCGRERNGCYKHFLFFLQSSRMFPTARAQYLPKMKKMRRTASICTDSPGTLTSRKGRKE